MTNLEIARLFDEEDLFKRTVLERLMESNGNISMCYCIFKADHEPLTEEQQRVLNEFGDGEHEIHLNVDINLDELL